MYLKKIIINKKEEKSRRISDSVLILLYSISNIIYYMYVK